ncbi:MAG: carbohydrate ABC transporter permease [Clostridia bacterium]|nr:carbohydrate ABC transporter permease [Clostridia bacterium]
MLKNRAYYRSQAIINVVMVLISMLFVLPLILLISSSLTDAEALKDGGYSLIPRSFSLAAYQSIFSNPQQIIDGYKTTIFVSVTAALAGTFVMCLTAYPLSRSYFPMKKVYNWFIFFPMLFSGGMIPSYIINTQYLNLDNTYWIYILPALCSTWNVIIIKTFFLGLPNEIFESAKIDGASELSIFFRFVLPLSKPVIATMALTTLLGKWNDWNTALLYIRDTELYSLQYLLQRILREAEFIKQMSYNTEINMGMIDVGSQQAAPEVIRYAMCIVAAGPALCIFPFFQKYFAKGLTVGSVKG